MRKNYTHLAIAALGLMLPSFSNECQAQITETPKGELRVYERTAGSAYCVKNQTPILQNEDGEAQFVFRGDSVFIQNSVSKYNDNAWVGGTLSDNGTKIHIPLGQTVYVTTRNKQYEGLDSLALPIKTAMLYSSGSGYERAESITEVTYTIDGNKIMLDGTGPGCIYGLVYGETSDKYWKPFEGYWCGYGCYGTVYTLKTANAIEQPRAATKAKPEYFDLTGCRVGSSFKGLVIQRSNEGKVAVRSRKMYHR